MKKLRITHDEAESGVTNSAESQDRMLTYIHREILRLDAERDSLHLTQREIIRAGNGTRRHLARDLALIERDLQMYRQVLSESERDVWTFMFSTWDLAETFDHCCADENEDLCLVAGYDAGHIRVGTHVIPLACAERNTVFADAEKHYLARTAITVANAGLRITALIHSHPGSGPDANHHSGTDARTQRAWEAHTKMISGIWSRGGYLRFFSVERPFEVIVVGAGVEQLEPGLFRFQTVDVE